VTQARETPLGFREVNLLDWTTRPDPFRVFHGAPRIALPLAADSLATRYNELRCGTLPPAHGFDLCLAWREGGTTRERHAQQRKVSGKSSQTIGKPRVAQEMPAAIVAAVPDVAAGFHWWQDGYQVDSSRRKQGD
jgi:hypothetical protein